MWGMTAPTGRPVFSFDPLMSLSYVASCLHACLLSFLMMLLRAANGFLHVLVVRQ
jgi:hypothetical protein